MRSAQDFGPASERWPLEWLKSLIAEGQSDPAVLVAIEAALPEETLILRELAVEVTQLLIARLAQHSRLTSRDVQAGQAALWNNLARRQGAMGQRAEALASIVESVRLFHALAAANPGAFLPDLASSLHNQATAQSEMGRRAEALASIAESIRIRQALAEANPGAFLPDLASSLNNQANRQSEMGQRAEAVVSIAKAIRNYHTLAEANPGTYLHLLAVSLNNQATMQSEMGSAPKRSLPSPKLSVSVARLWSRAPTPFSQASPCRSTT